MYKVGDKFLIEIDSVMTNKKGTLYGIKDFNSLTFNENGLNRLKPFSEFDVKADILESAGEEGYEKGLFDAWECMKKIDELGYDKKMEIFDVSNPIKNLTPQKAIEKLKAWEEKQEIKVGDVVVVYPNNYKACVIAVADTGQLTVYDKQRNTFKVHKDNVRKTGKHIDLTEIFKGLEGEDGD